VAVVASVAAGDDAGLRVALLAADPHLEIAPVVCAKRGGRAL
jgi:hypothetical protein